jgi:hypothetical protein
MTAFGDEPDLALGDSGDWVIQLQTRLHGLGLYDGAIDGAFGESTAKAVAEFQTRAGLTADGHVGAQTWQALRAAEQDAGNSAHGGHQAPVDGAHPDGTATAIGTLSEDRHWRWHGDGWQPNEEFAELTPAAAKDGGGRLSADGHWLWDGNQWQPVS